MILFTFKKNIFGDWFWIYYDLQSVSVSINKIKPSRRQHVRNNIIKVQGRGGGILLEPGRYLYNAINVVHDEFLYCTFTRTCNTQ